MPFPEAQFYHPGSVRAPKPALLAALLLLTACPKRVEPPQESPIPEIDFGETAWSITRIEAARPLTPEPLLPYLDDKDSVVRARAAVAVGRAGEAQGGEAAKPFVDALLGRLQDDEARVRRAALFGLGLIGPPAAGSVAAQLEKEGDPQARRMAVRAMGRIVPTDPEAASASPELRALVGRLRDPLEGGDAAIALGVYAVRAQRAGVEAAFLPDETVPGLQQRFRARSGPERWPFAYALYRIHPPEAASDFVIGLGDTDAGVRATCAKGIGALGDVPLRYDGLADALDDADINVRIEAARALGKRGSSGRDAIPDLFVLIDRGIHSNDPRDRHVAVAAADALAELRVPASSESIEKRLKGTKAFLFPALVRAYVATAGNDAAAVLTELINRSGTGEPSEVEPDESFGWMRRQSIALALSAAAPPSEPGDDASEKKGAPAAPKAIIELARQLSADSDGRVRWAAWDSYAALVGKDSAPLLIEALGDDDPAVVGTAAEKLGSWKWAAAGDALAARLKASLSDDPEVTVSLIHAVAALERKQDYDLLREIAGSENRAAALAALPVLRTAGVELPHTPHGRTPSRFPGLPEFTATGDLLRAVIKTSKGEITLHLLPHEAPLTVLNFGRLANRGFYRNITLHRVVPGFVAQDGCPRGDGWGGPGYGIACELNDRRYEAGTVGMALAGRDTGGSQWFIALTPQPHLEENYTIFARVVRGMDVVERLERGDRILDVEIH